MFKMRWRSGLCSKPRWGAHDAPPVPLVSWGGGHPIPSTLGALIRATALVFQPEPYHFLKRSGAHALAE